MFQGDKAARKQGRGETITQTSKLEDGKSNEMKNRTETDTKVVKILPNNKSTFAPDEQ